jgi:hypothetical protein
MRALIFSVAALFAVVPAIADEAVVVPDDSGRTVIKEHGLFHDKTTIIEHDRPDAVVVPEERRDETVSPDTGASSGEVGVDVETHEHVDPADVNR